MRRETNRTRIGAVIFLGTHLSTVWPLPGRTSRQPSWHRTSVTALPIDGAQYDRGRTGNAKLGDVVDATGIAIAGAEVTACTVDANGAITGTGCAAGSAAIRIGRTGDNDRSQRLWLIKFSKKLAEFSVPQ